MGLLLEAAPRRAVRHPHQGRDEVTAPEVDDLESLQRLAKREGRSEVRVFKDELRQAIAHPGQVPAMSSPATSSTTTAAPRSS